MIHLLQGDLLANLGWVDFDSGCFTILPTCSATFADFPSARAELGRGWNSTDQSQPNYPTKVRQEMGHPVQGVPSGRRPGLGCFDFKFSSVCQPPSWLKWLGIWAWWWNSQIKVNPTMVYDHLGHPVLYCDYDCLNFKLNLLKLVSKSFDQNPAVKCAELGDCPRDCGDHRRGEGRRRQEQGFCCGQAPLLQVRLHGLHRQRIPGTKSTYFWGLFMS